MITNRYYKLFKPFGMLSQFTREHDHPVLGDLYKFPKDVYPVGRLDTDSEGLLLLTNDKSINDLLLNPSRKHKRIYFSQVEGAITDEALSQLESGLPIRVNGKDHFARAEKATVAVQPDWVPERDPPIRYRKSIPESWVEIILTEGKNRQVRKMTAAAGFPTLRLIRWSIENIRLDRMKPGEVVEIARNDFYHDLGLK